MRLQIKLLIIIFIDISCIIASHFLAYGLRFDFILSEQLLVQIGQALPWLIIVKMITFYLLGLYKGMYRYTGLSDLVNILKAVVISSSIVISAIVYANRFSGVSRAVFILDGIFTFILLAGNRVGIRYLYAIIKNKKVFGLHEKRKNAKYLLLVGAGDSAEIIIREIHNNTGLPFVIVGLVDDDPRKNKRKIHGHSIHGTIDEIKSVVTSTGAEEILITIASATGKEMQRIVEKCQEAEVPFKIMPCVGEMINGKSVIKSIREISFRDLLGRPKVSLDQTKIGNYLTGQTILVTGAGGTIGSELCRQILRFDPKLVILLDAGEENLYNMEMELRYELNFTSYIAVLGKIQNRDLLNTIFCRYAPSVVFHAAAYKHVPLVETNPWEAIFNNVFASRNLVETAIFHKAKHFVLVSTDKAVRPTNVMGASKRLTELLMLAYCQDKWSAGMNKGNHSQRWKNDCKSEKVDDSLLCHDTKFMAVRFGNVLGSSGSVVPLFKRQINQGGPVTVTDPEINRYFMSIDEAAQLILQAGAMGTGGEIFLLKMGEPVKIEKLARDLIKLMGYEPDSEIEITYSGLRPGEKLYEELITEGEGIVPTTHDKIMVLRGESKSYQELEQDLGELAVVAKNHDAQGIKEVLARIIPEYVPDSKTKSIVDI